MPVAFIFIHWFNPVGFWVLLNTATKWTLWIEMLVSQNVIWSPIDEQWLTYYRQVVNLWCLHWTQTETFSVLILKTLFSNLLWCYSEAPANGAIMVFSFRSRILSFLLQFKDASRPPSELQPPWHNTVGNSDDLKISLFATMLKLTKTQIMIHLHHTPQLNHFSDT